MSSAAAEAATRYQRTFRGRADQVARVRHEIAAYLGGCPAADDATLIVSEIVSNAIVHSDSKGESFTVRCEIFRNHVLIEVRDAGGNWEPRGDDEGGRGLAIVAALTAEWGVDGDARGRTVWARIEW